LAYREDDCERDLGFDSGRAPTGVHLAQRDDLVALLDQLVDLEAQAVEGHPPHVASVSDPLDARSKQSDDGFGTSRL
jgi:hypothetical protein